MNRNETPHSCDHLETGSQQMARMANTNWGAKVLQGGPKNYATINLSIKSY